MSSLPSGDEDQCEQAEGRQLQPALKWQAGDRVLWDDPRRETERGTTETLDYTVGRTEKGDNSVSTLGLHCWKRSA